MIPKIKVIGIGGAGCNTISRLQKMNLQRVELWGVNTDSQSLKNLHCQNKLLIGETVTQGLGTGMNCSLGERAVKESYDKVKNIIGGCDILFLTAGLGGGTGTAGLPIFGEIAKEMNILTLAVVTLPFYFEGKARQKIAALGLSKVRKKVDSFLVIPNDKILKISDKDITVEEAFLKIDKMLSEIIEGVSEIFTASGIISLDFADLEEVLKNAGRALFGVGKAKGEHRAIAAASKALQSSFLGDSISGAKGILFNITGSDLALFEVNAVANFIKKIANSKTKIIFGVSENNNLQKGEIKVTLIATGIKDNKTYGRN